MTSTTWAPRTERLMHALADHLHDHCACDGLPDGTSCDACDLRAELRATREQLLAWHAHGRRLQERCTDALSNANGVARRSSGGCATCAGLAGLDAALAPREPQS